MSSQNPHHCVPGCPVGAERLAGLRPAGQLAGSRQDRFGVRAQGGIGGQGEGAEQRSIEPHDCRRLLGVCLHTN